MTTRSAVFLDRDGVINEPIVVDGRPHPPGSVRDLCIVAGAGEALRDLSARGFLLIVVTNQPDIARGTSTWFDVEAINGRLRELLPLDDVVVCPHDDHDRCECRKPGGGMLVEAAQRHGIDLLSSFLIGDRWRDIGAAHAAGVHPIFIDRHYDERRPEGAYMSVADLSEAVRFILSRVPDGRSAAAMER